MRLVTALCLPSVLHWMARPYESYCKVSSRLYMSSVLISLVVSQVWCSAQGQVWGSWQIPNKDRVASEGRLDRKERKDVVLELKISKAQREEIQSMVASFSQDCSKLFRTLRVLREDCRIAALTEPRDETEVKRIQEEERATQQEINRKALQRMSEITSMLSSGQLQRLRNLRKEELERCVNERNRGRGDESADTPRRMQNMQTFRMFAGIGMGEQELFDPDAVFCYPDRELWLSEDRAGFGSLSFNGNDMGAGIQGFPDVESLLKQFDLRGFSGLQGLQGLQDFDIDIQPFSDDNSEPRRSPRSRRFEFRYRDRQKENDSTSVENGPGSNYADPDQLMDSTPFTLPVPRTERNGKNDRDGGNDREWRSEKNETSETSRSERQQKLREQITDLRKALETLEKELKAGDD